MIPPSREYSTEVDGKRVVEPGRCSTRPIASGLRLALIAGKGCIERYIVTPSGARHPDLSARPSVRSDREMFQPAFF
jgi:hypothetical protein